MLSLTEDDSMDCFTKAGFESVKITRIHQPLHTVLLLLFDLQVLC